MYHISYHRISYHIKTINYLLSTLCRVVINIYFLPQEDCPQSHNYWGKFRMQCLLPRPIRSHINGVLLLAVTSSNWPSSFLQIISMLSFRRIFRLWHCGVQRLGTPHTWTLKFRIHMPPPSSGTNSQVQAWQHYTFSKPPPAQKKTHYFRLPPRCETFVLLGYYVT